MKSANLWDIFCRVIDNYGDIGVCWRLAADLAARGHHIRLWVDDASALAWMAPGALQGNWPRVRVMAWDQARDPALLPTLPPADVWIEGFGCEIPSEFVALRFKTSGTAGTDTFPKPIWLNLEYLSAETFTQRAHGLPSPCMHGPATGHTRYFFYPGFTPRTGGLLRESGLTQRQSRFNRSEWLASHGIGWQGERLVSMFCYEPAALADLLGLLQRGPERTQLLVSDGRAAAAVRRLLPDQNALPPSGATDNPGCLSVNYLAPLPQTDFDHLLWSCDLNFVRGEDSLVRAIWAGKPWVWQIYPQQDDAHHAKLNALLHTLDGAASWRSFHRIWNGIDQSPLPLPDLSGWGWAASRARHGLMQQDDLTTRLLKFVAAVPVAHQIQAEKS